MAEAEVFTLDGDPHPTEEDCRWCWPGYPVPCSVEGCDGLVHAVFGDENYDMDYWLYFKCTKCGSTDEP
jgi:hypothetical protein